jgi:hypothetical protein
VVRRENNREMYKYNREIKRYLRNVQKFYEIV